MSFKGLKIFTLTEAATMKFIDLGVIRTRLDIKRFRDRVHPREDYLLVSRRYPIFCVADGVTLEPDAQGRYPHPSGASEIAKIFCKKVIEEAERRYANFSESDLKAVFQNANSAVGKYNRQHGRTKKNSNFWSFDLFAATAAFAVIKNRTAYWASICDSYITRFDARGELKFKCLSCWLNIKQCLPKEWGKLPEPEQKKIIRSKYRNGIDKQGKLIGYGVVTGEKTALKYLEHGSWLIEPSDLILLFTDGFEEYSYLPKFIQLFNLWPPDLKTRVKQFTAQKSVQNPERFGQERSLIAISFR